MTVTREQFITRARAKHGMMYLYTAVVFMNMQTKVLIKCPLHKPFWQTPNSHCLGKGCPECGFKRRVQSTTCTVKQFISRAVKLHGDKYDYSLVAATWAGMAKPVTIVCPVHGNFSQKARRHCCVGNGCRKCHLVSRISTTEDFIHKADKIHQGFYNYNDVVYVNARTNVVIRCPKHGPFLQTPNKHLDGQGCSGCNSRHSRAAQGWLEAMALVLDLDIQHAGNGKEFRIPTTNFKADGYCKATNTIFEFHG